MTGQFSDLTLACGEEVFKAHRVIVCSQSSIFAGLCLQSKVRFTKYQAKYRMPRLSVQFSGLINLNEHDSEAVMKMVEFLYTGSYSTIETSPTFSIHTHMKVYSLGLRYQIQGLVALSLKKFATSLSRVSDLEVYFQSLRDVYNLPAIKQEVFSDRDAPDDTASANHICAEIIGTALTELSKILSSPPVLARFQEICSEVPQFHADFLTALMEMNMDAENEENIPPLCRICGPSGEGYEIEVTCELCGNLCQHVFR